MSINSNIVVTLGNGSWYSQGVLRQTESLAAIRGQGRDYSYTGELDHWAGGPSHKEKPYAFKCSLIENARKVAGYQRVLWCDASVWFVADPSPVFRHIAQYGGYFLRDGWNVGQWCSDAALEPLGITREEAFGIPLLYNIVCGFDFGNSVARAAFEWWHELALKTDAFRGPWDNKDGAASKDPRVLGHRHDQTALSVIVHRLGLPTIPVGSSHLQCVAGPPPHAHRNDVVMLAQGM